MLRGILDLVRDILELALFVIYAVIGLIVAYAHHYFAHLNGAKPIASAVIAVLLWPLLVFGVNLHIK